jgi:hypothetical protein
MVWEIITTLKNYWQCWTKKIIISYILIASKIVTATLQRKSDAANVIPSRQAFENRLRAQTGLW